MSCAPLVSFFLLVCFGVAYKHARWKSHCHGPLGMNSREGVLAGSFESSFNKGQTQETIIYADSDIIVVDKPANLQTAPGYMHKECLARRVADAYNIERVDTIIVHRLDYATSGLVVFARNLIALKALNAQFRSKSKVFKSYMAIVDGRVEHKNGIVDLPIGRDKQRGPPYYCVDRSRSSAGAKEAETHWSVMEAGATCTMVKLLPVTGRTHQLRLHMAALGHPILGDAFYGHTITADHKGCAPQTALLAPEHEGAPCTQEREATPIKSVQTASRSAYARADRLLLHATELHLLHPTTEEVVKFLSPCPFLVRDYDEHKQ